MADQASSSTAPVQAPARKKPPGTLLFVPASLNRGAFLVWLKRIHAWTGFWGALAFLLLGSSGLLLNHRATLKIDTGEPQEVSSVVVNVDPALIKSPEDLGAWAKKEFNLSVEARAPRNGGGEGARPGGPGGGGQGGPTREGGERASFNGREVKQAEVWKQNFGGTNGAVLVEYSPGSGTVKATRTEQNFGGFLKNLHKGSGMNAAWVLLIDTFAGGLIAMSITGALLWSRMHGPRLAAIGIVLASLGLALFAGLPGMV